MKNDLIDTSKTTYCLPQVFFESANSQNTNVNNSLSIKEKNYAPNSTSAVTSQEPEFDTNISSQNHLKKVEYPRDFGSVWPQQKNIIVRSVTKFSLTTHSKNKVVNNSAKMAGTILLSIGILCLLILVFGLLIYFTDVLFAIFIPLFFVTTTLGLWILIRSANSAPSSVISDNNPKEPKSKNQKVQSRSKLFKKMLLWSFVGFIGSVGIGALSWKFSWQIDIIMEFLALVAIILIFFSLIALVFSLNK